ncbi:MAG: GTPase HflX [Clostridiales bacterium]|jgi:GTP-binding protein hflX|nr:GTPase HflX [Clostridiales bacterium]
MAENKTIYGNITAIRTSLLERMKEFADNTYSPGSFIPKEILTMMTDATCETNKEIAVFLDRRNRVIAIAIGNDKSVPLPELEGRKSSLRLSGIRCLHTHPNGTVRPSNVDLQSLKTMRYDAMVVIGIDPEKKRSCGASVTLLARDENGVLNRTETIGPVSTARIVYFDNIFDDLLEIDRTAAAYGNTTQKIKRERERAILVGVLPENKQFTGDPLAELHELAESAGAEPVEHFTQKREAPDARTYIGRGLAEELSLKRQALNVSLIIFDDELSASQIRNLENITGARVIDRTALILDIFASRAKSREGRLQVELAQQKYRLPRLMGQGTSLSRLGGGIGTRGPGETQLETDRRHIKRKINYLEAQLREVKERRGVLRKERQKKEIPTVAVVGYTNAGKSTLVNTLCNSDVFVEDQLFATLDTSVRRLVTPEHRDFLLIDTVGFIKKLPHDLIEAFKSTLEETVYADLLLHVVDASNPDFETCIDTVEKILQEIGAGNRPRYLILNKIDKASEEITPSPRVAGGYGKAFNVSALRGDGLELLKKEIVNYFVKVDKKYECILPYEKAGVLSYLHEKGTVEREEYREDGIYVKGKMPPEHFERVSGYEMRERKEL